MRTKILAALLLGNLVVTAVTSIGLFAADGSSSSLPAVALITPLSSSLQARLDPANRTGSSGEDPLSRNFNWSAPLVALPGRAGLDLGLSLTYNSLVWTRSGSEVSFDDDFGFPAPGFRLGFPAIQPLYLNPETGRNSYLLITPGGARVELRQVGTSSLYHAADSSYLLLDSTNMTLRTTDGTQLSYAWMGNDYQCTQIKDRNGNFITISYTSFGRIDAIVDTLARTIEFNYDAGNYLSSITQIWTVNGAAQTHTWGVICLYQQNYSNQFHRPHERGAAEWFNRKNAHPGDA